MAQYGTVDLLANPLLKIVTTGWDIAPSHVRYIVVGYFLGAAQKPVFYGAYRSQRLASAAAARLINGLTLAYVVFFGAGGQYWWLKQGQTPPP